MAAPIPSTRPSRDGENARRDEAEAGGTRARWRPKAQVRALFPQSGEGADKEGGVQVSDWASAFGDLSRQALSRGMDGVGPSELVEWRVHDKTHLEFAIDYPLATEEQTRIWESYFFVPESFRIHDATYSKKAIYEDLQSYVRYAVPDLPFEELARSAPGAWLDRVATALERADGAEDGSDAAKEATRTLRLWCCLVRGSGLLAMRAVETHLDVSLDPTNLRRDALAFVVSCNGLSRGFHGVVEGALRRVLPHEVEFALRWCEEATSLAIETLCADLAIKLEENAAVEAVLPDLAEQVAAQAVAEARHRADRGYDSVARAGATERDVEHLEFRRHVLKRFTASVLWLSLEMREGAAWVLHIFYAVAAAVAMSFAVFAAFGTSRFSDDVFRGAIMVVIAYAVKDRMKALLQDRFNKWISARFPDRRWAIHDHERNREVGSVRERAGFVAFDRVPEPVLAKRRLTREHSLEECARPERVLWHEKVIHVAPSQDETFPMLTEIFRLNIAHWLAHTDDPKRKVLFADPDDASVYSAIARRVYNVSVVYRLRGASDDTPWHRIRVVVSRKGILRIEPIC